MASPSPLKLLAQDLEDLAVISAALQDAVVKVGDIVFEAKARRLTLATNRYRWEAGGGSRVRAALQVGGALKVKARGVRPDRPEAMLALLAVTFEPGEAPGGALLLNFAGGADLRVEVECLDAALADVSEPWPTPRTPRHQL